MILRSAIIEGTEYTVTVSDDSKALHAAYAAGGAIIGIWDEGQGWEAFSPCLYLVTSPEDVDSRMLERVVRRRMGMPWRIGETERILIREFKKNDPLADTDADEDGRTEGFTDRDRRDAYIDSQYGFHECGLWALVEKATGALLGKAGIMNGEPGYELGYYIDRPYRRQGYAFEACQGILRYAEEELETDKIYLKTNKENIPSVKLADRLNFMLLREEAGVLYYERRL